MSLQPWGDNLPAPTGPGDGWDVPDGDGWDAEPDVDSPPARPPDEAGGGWFGGGGDDRGCACSHDPGCPYAPRPGLLRRLFGT